MTITALGNRSAQLPGVPCAHPKDHQGGELPEAELHFRMEARKYPAAAMLITGIIISFHSPPPPCFSCFGFFFFFVTAVFLSSQQVLLGPEQWWRLLSHCVDKWKGTTNGSVVLFSQGHSTSGNSYYFYLLALCHCTMYLLQPPLSVTARSFLTFNKNGRALSSWAGSFCKVHS